MRRRSSRCAVASRARDSLISSSCRASSARRARRCRSRRRPRWPPPRPRSRSFCAGSNSIFAATSAACRRTSTTSPPAATARPSEVTHVAAVGGVEDARAGIVQSAVRSASRSGVAAASPDRTVSTASNRVAVDAPPDCPASPDVGDPGGARARERRQDRRQLRAGSIGVVRLIDHDHDDEADDHGDRRDGVSRPSRSRRVRRRRGGSAAPKGRPRPRS